MTPQVISLSSATSTAWIPVDYKQNPFNIDVAVVLSNTPNLTYKVEYTLDDVFNPAITPTAFSHSTLVGLTANRQAPITSPVRAIRLTITAWISGTATMTALQGAVNPVIYTANGGIRSIRFESFAKSLLASLQATSTASRTSNVVTITSTAHGVTTGTTYVGYRYFYPGSPSLIAGWYDSILSIPDANTITFSAPGTDFGSESINGGAAYLAGTAMSDTITIPASTFSTNSLYLGVTSGGGVTASQKYTKPMINSTSMSISPGTTFPFTHRMFNLVALTPTTISSSFCQYNGVSSSLIIVSFDNTIDNTVGVNLQITAAGDFLTVYSITAYLVPTKVF